jgi:large subunit ribosomal protein L22
MSASKARLVLDLVRGKDVMRAQEILAATPREAASVIAKVLASAIANAVNNDGQVADELFITSAFADEGATMKRFRPRARGRAARIRKRSCHVTIIVARMDESQLERARATRSTDAASRSRRVAGSRRRADQQSHAHRREVAREEAAVVAEETAAEEAAAAAALEGEASGADGTATDVTDTEAREDDAKVTDEAEAATDAAPEAPEDDAAAASEEHTD